MKWRTEQEWSKLERWMRGGPSVDRRDVLKLLGASVALATGAGCSRDPVQKILPYTSIPPEATPGVPRWYSSIALDQGAAIGILVESNDGRPTKIEGNPDHPASLGAAGAVEQALVLGVYDPHRARAISGPKAATWDGFAKVVGAPRDDHGAGLRVLLEPTSSPLVLDALDRLRKQFPDMRIAFHSTTSARSRMNAARSMFGRAVAPLYDFTAADIVVALDADFLMHGPMRLRYARDFVSRRRAARPGDPMNRLYVVEPALTVTGAAADHRLARRAGDVPAIATKLFAGARGDKVDDAWLAAVARDLVKSGPRTLVVAGDDQPESVHAAAIAINAHLRSAAVRYIDPVASTDLPNVQELSELVADMRKGAVDTLLILDSNAVYSAPVDLDFAEAMKHVKTTAYLGAYEDETAQRSAWFVPMAHPLEAWGDGRAVDGTMSIAQPTIRPLHDGKSIDDVLAAVVGDAHRSSYERLRALHRDRASTGGFDQVWNEALTRGVMSGTAFDKVDVTARAELPANEAAHAATDGIEIAFAHDDKTRDGRYANLAWLQELPEPMTKLTWDNAALVSAATARRLNIADEDVVDIEVDARKLRATVLVGMGAADECVTLALGYGREGAEHVARGVGADAFAIRASTSPRFVRGAIVTRTGEKSSLARTQEHWSMEGRAIALRRSATDYAKDPGFTAEHKEPVPSLLRAPPTGGEQWAMAIDLTACIGCSACVVACQAENNILVVGKQGVMDSREMHWLRIDTYFDGPPEAPEPIHQPMACQHCEQAPCEYVCPVNATVHSPDGLNEMVYNRCVGTRFCQNNCPYKVRRFNWFDWIDHCEENQGLVKLQRNPDVTVRERGVMEKCTYCVQRIRGAEIKARNEDREIGKSEVVTACQQACPTQAISFGSLRHPDADVVEKRNQPRSYAVLHDQGTSARTRYLARITNPNPELSADPSERHE